MLTHRKIMPGDEIEILVAEDRVHRTLIREVADGELFLVAMPIADGAMPQLGADEETTILYYRESGMFIVRVKVLSITEEDGVWKIWLKQAAPAEKKQRREYFRTPAKVTATMYRLPEEEPGQEQGRAPGAAPAAPDAIEEVETEDVSVSGVSIISKREYRVGERYMLKLNLYGAIRPLVLRVEVRRAFPRRDSEFYVVGMRFLDLTEDASDALAKFVTTRQQNLIANRKLVKQEGL